MEVYGFHLMPYPYGDDKVAWPISADRFDPEKGVDLYERYLSEMTYCEELGFDAVAFNEHHYRAFGLMPSPNLVAANVAGRTSDVDIAIYGNILPLRENPVRVAEELAMLDNMSGGRLVCGFLRGLPNEYEAYGIDQDDSRGRLAEAWDLLERALTEPDPFDFEGEHYEFENVGIWPRPVQEPHPPFRMPAMSEESIRFAVDKQVPISRTFCSTEGMTETFETYRTFADGAGWTPDDEHFEAGRIVYVAETMERAREEAEEHLRYFYDRLLISALRTAAVFEVGDARYRPEHDDQYEAALRDVVPPVFHEWLDFDFERLQELGEIVVGDPSYVAAEIERQHEATGGFGRLITQFHFGTLPGHLTRKNLELFADEVVPEIRGL